MGSLKIDGWARDVVLSRLLPHKCIYSETTGRYATEQTTTVACN